MPAGSPTTFPVNPNVLDDAAHQCNEMACASDLVARVLRDITALQQEIAALGALCAGASGGGAMRPLGPRCVANDITDRPTAGP